MGYAQFYILLFFPYFVIFFLGKQAQPTMQQLILSQNINTITFC